MKVKLLLLSLVLTLTMLLAACGDNTATNSSTGSNGNQNTSSQSSDGDNSKIDPCHLFSQSDADTTLGVKAEKTDRIDSTAFNDCIYKTQDGGATTSSYATRLTVVVFIPEATPGWYSGVKKGYAELDPNIKLIPVEGLGNDAFTFLKDDYFSNSKSVHVGVLKGKVFFTVEVEFPKLGEAEQTTALKTLAQTIANHLN